MKKNGASLSWVPALRKASGPLYLAIADEIAADIAAGRLQDGARLPPQRALAAALSIDFTTISRAYNEARRRGLIEGRVGQGTYVRARRGSAGGSSSGGLVDMSMNLPPLFDDPALATRMWDDIGALQDEQGLGLLMRYQAAGGARRDRVAGANWLKPRLGDIPADRVLVCPGAQGALLATLSVLAAGGGSICAEALTYPGLRSLAAHLGIEVLGVAMDEKGLLPDAFEAVCLARRPKALYCNPTLHNPTSATLPLERREAIVAIARRHGVAIIEDDAYGALPASPLPPLAALAPDLVYHVAGLAKCLSPALRIAYLVVPDSTRSVRLESAVRATAGMASPLSAAIATCWIENGTAEAVLAAIRTETGVRQQIAAESLPATHLLADREGFHLWLKLPLEWARGEFTARLWTAGIAVVASDAFALSAPPEAVRLGLGAAETRTELQRSLRVIADLLAQSPAALNLVI
ncbi:PLP-dependent aminotransferase family protein [Sinorhizobium numidicum]|uniref:PLP-dependent aminotransferase family protein n=1 Tax=Sinorhizobium numidicum TaxID=680248 RepID=A0ABY8CW91_9HYPH|nr:PLP-dependent aminotransferase family protein [Sinorhizobium numidicum]WEX76247.1 PLP-dependent aminotransferase family protein [Sinorhizobium numidicum]WEX82906.1 PLP-dependent aminotransferase family protein [Sinorhizobium numidicum]